MASKKCCIDGCTSQEGLEKDNGVTFHRFPNPAHVNKWLNACKLDSSFKITKNTFVCSRHFKRENFIAQQATGKIVLKALSVPSIFPWNKSAVVVSKNSSPAGSKPSTPPPPDKKSESDGKTKAELKVEKDDSGSASKISASKVEAATRKVNSQRKKEPPKTVHVKLDDKTKKSKRLSARTEAAKIKTDPVVPTPERVKPESVAKATPPASTPKKKSQVVNFVPGTSIEAQNFDGKWICVKVIEVDMEEREVLVRTCDKNNKSKTGTNDEWISMDSPRLRPAQPIVTFEVAEKVLARWNDCRKFPATIKRVLDNDTYDVLFDDGYPKIVRGIHINKYSAKNAPKTPTSESPVQALINPLLLNPPSLIPDYIKAMKDTPVSPTEGEWCCSWVDDIPIGEESTFDGPHGKLPSIIVPDWRIKEGWQKHIYLRQNGKWDVLFISPTYRKLRFKNELKIYLSEIGETYDPEIWDFSLHKKRSKLLGLCKTTDKFKNEVMSNSFDMSQEQPDGTQAFNNPYAALGALPYVQPNLVLAPPTQTEIRVGALKVKVINNIYQCPQETCDKTFRKENHLQLHIKHYHEDLSKLMGECLNMEDLAYLRTTVDEQEASPPKQTRKSHGPKPRPRLDLNDSFKEIHVRTENGGESKLHPLRSPILEEALKAPLVTGYQPVKTEKESDIKFDPSENGYQLHHFDPETLIPPHSVSKTGHVRFSPSRKRLRGRFNPKQKKPGPKKRRLETYRSEIDEASSIPGIIPYHEGPYFKHQQQTSFLDDNGEYIKIVRMKKEEVINCLCGYGEEDGLMIQCDLCLCWQHGVCNNIEKAHEVPEKYVCLICKNPARQRSSQKYIHDQDWLYEGKLPTASFRAPNPKQTARYDTLKQCHTLIGNLQEIKKFMNSLDVKINIAEKPGHPKLYLWAKKWEQSPPRATTDSKDEVKRDINFEEADGDIRMLPIIPEPEVAIEPAKCQQTLLDHIQYQQDATKTRLESIDAEISALEESSATLCNGKILIDEPRMKQTIFMLINDVMKMNELASINRSSLLSNEYLQ